MFMYIEKISRNLLVIIHTDNPYDFFSIQTVDLTLNNSVLNSDLILKRYFCNDFI